jgi:hypothetical protein
MPAIPGLLPHDGTWTKPAADPHDSRKIRAGENGVIICDIQQFAAYFRLIISMLDQQGSTFREMSRCSSDDLA